MKLLGPTYDKAKDAGRKILPSPAWSLLRLLWARFSFGAFKPRIVRHRYGSHELHMELIDFDGAYWYDRDIDDFPEITLLSRYGLVPGARIFNAGANQCLQAMLMAKTVGPQGFVWAVEPNPRNAQAARRNLQLNGISNCEVLDGAVANFDGRISVNQAMNGQVSAGRWRIGAQPVDAFMIDSLARRVGPPDVLYIDIEGFECAALEGARKTLGEHMPDCFVEVHTQIGLEKLGGSVEKLLSYFPHSRYQLLACGGRDSTFREVTSLGHLPKRRFFLIALARASQRHIADPVFAGRNANL